MTQSSRYDMNATKSLCREMKKKEMLIGLEPALIPESCQVRDTWPCHPHMPIHSLARPSNRLNILTST